MSHDRMTYRSQCAECDAGGACLGHRVGIPTRAQMLAYVSYRLPAPKELTEREAAEVKAMNGCFPQYIGGPKHGQRTDYSRPFRPLSDVREDFDDYWCQPHLDKFRYHASVIADPRRWEKLMAQYVEMEVVERKEMAAKYRAEKAEKSVPPAPPKRRRAK